MDLVDAIADAITTETGVKVKAEEAGGEELALGGEEEEGEEMEGGEELGMAPELSDEEIMAEKYIRDKVRQALVTESKTHTKQPSKLEEKIATLYNHRMRQLSKPVYVKAEADIVKEVRTETLSNEVQRRVLSRILEDTKNK